MKGRIIKGIAGFYYVKVGGDVYQCKARGIFKKEKVTPTVGDNVDIEVLDDGDAVINEIFPRKNIFVRPPISNVDVIAVVVACTDPAPNMSVIDNLLVMIEKSNAEGMICVNKIDLAEDPKADKISDIYGSIYPVVCTSGIKDTEINELKDMLKGKSAALVGPSGVGKSTLLNRLQQGINAETGAISDKTQRGKHTTRHVEIFTTDFGADIYDTPGFTSFEVLDACEEELDEMYPEMRPLIGMCRYDDCRHINEPGCRVKQAVESGEIHKSRYRSYERQYQEIKNKKKY